MRRCWRGALVWLVTVGALLGGLLLPARASTPAGTVISNTAPVTYEGPDGNQQKAASNPANIAVAVAPALQLSPSYDRSAVVGQEILLAHTFRNTGNVALNVRFALQGGAWHPALFLDSNANERVDAGEQAPGSSVLVDIGQSVSLVIAVTPPPLTADGATDRFTLAASTVDGALSGTVPDTLHALSNAPAKIQLVAEPSTILGDGKERSRLTATVLTVRDVPVPDGTPVLFTTPRGTFDGGGQSITGNTLSGVASTWLTGDVVSNTPVTVVAHVVAGTPQTGTAAADVTLLFTPAAITGLVLDHQTQRPLPRVPVTLLDASGNPAGQASTAADGSYDLPISTTGTYTLRIPVKNSAGDTVVLTETIVVDRLGGATFTPQGAIVGVIADVNSRQPLANVVVNVLLNPVAPRGGTPSGAASRDSQLYQVTTSARGGFVINGLPLGAYDLVVSAADGTHYAHGRANVGLSQPGEYVVNADILLDPLGFVYDHQTGARIPGATVTLNDAVTGQTVSLPNALNPQVTPQDGTYQFIPGPGAYALHVAAPGYLASDTSFTATRDVINPNVPLDPLPQLALRKQVDHAQAQPGDELIYSLTAANTGQGAASAVVLADTLPEFLVPVPETLGPGASYDASTRRITWRLGVLPGPQGSATLAFHARVVMGMPEGNTDVINNAQLSCAEVPTPVEERAATRVTALPRLEISKTVDRAVAAPGDTLHFTLSVRNTGGADAREVTITDALPDGLVLPGGGKTASWRLDQLPVGAMEVRTLDARVDAAGLTPGLHTLTNTAEAKSASTDPVRGQAQVEVLVPYLSITKRALLSDVQVGDVVPFEVVVKNLSPSDEATSLQIRDTLPPGLAYRAGTTRVDGAKAAEPAIQGRVRVWQVPRLAGNSSVRISFQCVVTAGNRADTVVNVADVTGTASTGQPLAAGPARASLRIQQGFFSERAMIIGRVFVDTNGDGMPDDGKPGLANVAVFTETGMMAITDEEGKYVLPDISPGDHVVRLDTFTLPAGYVLVATDTGNAGTARSRFCRIQKGGLAKANFTARGTGPRVGSARAGTPELKPDDRYRQ